MLSLIKSLATRILKRETALRSDTCSFVLAPNEMRNILATSRAIHMIRVTTECGKVSKFDGDGRHCRRVETMFKAERNLSKKKKNERAKRKRRKGIKKRRKRIKRKRRRRKKRKRRKRRKRRKIATMYIELRRIVRVEC